MERFCRLQGERRRPGTRKRPGNLPSDEPRLAHACNYNAAFAAKQQFHRSLERGIQPLEHLLKRLRFNAQNAATRLETHRPPSSVPAAAVTRGRGAACCAPRSKANVA